MSTSRNAPCPCGSGKKYKKCCLVQDEKSAAEGREQQRLAEKAEHEAFVKYATDLDELSNKANDLIRSSQWSEAEDCCRQLREQFPKEIDGDHRSYEYYKARGDFIRAKTHALATLKMVQRAGDAFDPSFPARLKTDIAAFDEQIEPGSLPG